MTNLNAKANGHKKIQTTHFQFLRLYQWLEANRVEASKHLFDAVRLRAERDLDFPVSPNALQNVAESLRVEFPRRPRRKSADPAHVAARKRGSLILARALLYLYDELGLKGPAADQHRSGLRMLAMSKQIPTEPGSESMF